MIRRLEIQNYAIIEELLIDFSEGLTIITGETGAGKSILLGALGLIMGKRADTKVLFNTSRKCFVEGVFEVADYRLQSFFEENDLDYEDQVVVRREISPSGKSRAFVNDTPVNLKILQELSESLIDLHQQFDTLDIHDEGFQLRMIDALAGNKEAVLQYAEKFKNYQKDKRSLEKLLSGRQQAAKEAEFLKFQLEEFEKAELEENEQELLEEELSMLSNAESIKQTTGAVFQHLSESEQSVVSQLQELTVSLGQLAKYHSSLEKIHQRFEGLVFEIEDVSNELEQIAEETEFNPERLQAVQERLDLVYRLQSKHQVSSIKELLDIQADLQQQLDNIGDETSRIDVLKESLKHQEAALRESAADLRYRRVAVIPAFEKRVKALLKELSMEHARLQVELVQLEELNATGLDELHFLFAANKGGRLQQIRDVASGGELSRLALVTKSLVAKAIPLPTIVFDEIDTGISGDVALKMGEILRRFSNEHQIVTITHSPQVASKADVHYFVFKKIKDDRTVTNVRLLNHDECVRAIAVMLSSNPPSDFALKNARELIEKK